MYGERLATSHATVEEALDFVAERFEMAAQHARLHARKELVHYQQRFQLI